MASKTTTFSRAIEIIDYKVEPDKHQATYIINQTYEIFGTYANAVFVLPNSWLSAFALPLDEELKK